jgi:hypothetical protein
VWHSDIDLKIDLRPVIVFLPTMSSNLHLGSSSSLPFQAIFNAALNEYSQKTGKDIVTDPLTAKLQCCTSPDAVINVLQEEAQAFNDFRNGNRKVQLMRKLKPTVDILLALSTNGALGNEIGSVSAQKSRYALRVNFISFLVVISACKCDLGGHWHFTRSTSSVLHLGAR